MKDSWRHFIAEFVGTFALVFVGGGAIIAGAASGASSLAAVALAHGLILSVMVTATMRISGHFNPAVTIAFLVVRRIEATMAALYIVAQLFASLAAAYFLRALLPEGPATATQLGGQALATGISMGQGIALETIATFFLVFVIFGTAVDPDAPRVGGFAIGLTVAADILAIGPFTGASMNPARSFGPAVAALNFQGHAAYWIGPIIGGIIAAVLYDRVFLRRAPEPVDHGAVRPVE
jgi:MIP family channel proteins